MAPPSCRPRAIRVHLSPARLALGREFLRFGLVGLAGLVADTAVIHGLRGALGLAWAGMASFPVAATVTFTLNRAWTFRGRGPAGWWRQWLRFLAVNAVGMVLNRGTYLLLIGLAPICVAYPVLAVAAGACAGMFVNFSLSRHLIFRAA